MTAKEKERAALLATEVATFMCSGCPGDVENPEMTAADLAEYSTGWTLDEPAMALHKAIQRCEQADAALDEVLGELRAAVRDARANFEKLLAAEPTNPGPNANSPGDSPTTTPPEELP